MILCFGGGGREKDKLQVCVGEEDGDSAGVFPKIKTLQTNHEREREKEHRKKPEKTVKLLSWASIEKQQPKGRENIGCCMD